MGMKKQIFQYVTFIVIFFLFIGFLIYLESPEIVFKEFYGNFREKFSILILQLIIVLSITCLFGYLCGKISQPSVIGQIIAGIALGPSLMGILFPDFFAFLFTPDSLKALKFFSDLGLILYMFIVGLELDIELLKHKARQAVFISNGGIIVPFILGIILSLFLYKTYAPPHISMISFALFIGISLSITAFPVLARIIQERGITKTHVGTMALVSAAADDVTAWCLLVAVIAIASSGNIYTFFLTIAFSIVYIFIMFVIVRPFMKKISEKYLTNQKMHKTFVSIIFLVLLISSYMTHIIGIHTLFGAFIAGVIMPHNLDFKKNFVEKIEDVSLVLLLPLFFVFSGLRTQISLLNNINEWLVLGAVVLVAIIGKFGGCVVAARLAGEDWKDTLSIGALMNTRGLMELIILNIGYDLGILSQEVFSIFVLMALITTFLTNPALDLIDRVWKK